MMSKVGRVSMVPSEALFPVIEESLRAGQDVVLPVRGNSMFPLMRSDRDSVKLTAAEFGQIKKGDITLIRRDSGAYVIHRVCKKTPNAFYMVGDHQREVEGPLRPDQLIAVTSEVHRSKRVIRRGSALWGVYGSIWLFLRPVRGPVLAALVKVYKVLRLGGNREEK